MKTLFAIVLALTLVFSLACAGAEHLSGGWSATESLEIPENVRAAFDKAMNGLVGVNYEPVAYLGYQVVAGMNHCILCRATVVYPGARPYYALVYVYENLAGGAEILDIQTLEMAPDYGAPELLPLPVSMDTSSLAGRTVYAVPGLLNAEEKTIELTVIEPETFEAAYIENLKVGDTITSDGVDYTVETITREEYYTIINEGEYEYSDGSLWLRKDANGDWRTVCYEDFVWIETGTYVCRISDDMLFLDGIDPITGEMLEEPTQHTAADFMRMYDAEENGKEFAGPGYTCNNFRAAFDEAGNLASVERFYVPWQ